MIEKQQFQQQLLQWFAKHGRKNLPWQRANGYYVWISEIMLQQTQVQKVKTYFTAFIEKFPTLEILAMAKLDEVLSMWSGLGYYNRARNIHKTALICCKKHDKSLPHSFSDLLDLPGIGKTTAGAIMSLAYGQPYAILDGNVKRVISRVFRVKAKKISQYNNKLWHIVENLVSEKNATDYNQALMDLGSLVCRRSNPQCEKCPFMTTCQARMTDEIDLLPMKKTATKQIPQTLDVLLCINDRRIFLQQRPNTGIWAGLWFLPVFSSIDDLFDAVSGKIDSTFQYLHVLSHRKLSITVYVSKKIPNAAQGQWHSLNQLHKIAYPSALLKAISQISL